MTRTKILVSAIALVMAAGGAHAKGHDQSQASSDARTANTQTPPDGSAPGTNVDVTTGSAQSLGFILGNRATETPPGQAKKK